jgi:phage terminase large subunit-like protein
MPTAFVDYVPAEVMLFRDQAKLIKAAGQPGGAGECAAVELVAMAEPKSGASRALMMLGIMIAQATPGARVLIVGRDLSTMRENWAGQTDGFWIFCRPMVAAGQCSTHSWFVSFKAIDSRVHFKMPAHARQIRDATHLLIDDAHDIDAELFQDLREQVLSRPPLQNERAGATRIAITARRGTTKWPAGFASLVQGSKLVLEMLGDDLPPEMRQDTPRGAPREHLTLREAVSRAEPGYVWHYHNEAIAWTLQLGLDREVDEIWMEAPPGYGKSWLTSSGFPMTELWNWPSSRAIVTAATDPLAAKHSRVSRRWYRALGGIVQRQQDSIYEWATSAHGTYVAVGKHSAILSHRGDLIVFDDPFASSIEASRKSAQEHAWHLWDEELPTRKNKYGHRPPVMVLQHQRLERQDVIGRAIDAERLAASGQKVAFLNLQAIKRKSYLVLPPTVYDVTGVADERAEGEALCEEIEPLAKLLKIEERNPSRFRAKFQGDPTPAAEGDMFSRAHLVELAPDQVPPLSAFSQLVRSWDFAYSAKADADATASSLWGRLIEPIPQPTGKAIEFVILHATNDRLAPQRMMAKVNTTAERDGKHVMVILPQDPAAGVALYDILSTQLAMAGFVIIKGSVRGSKRVKATPMAGAMTPAVGQETGAVAIVRVRGGSDLELLVDQLDAFTGEDGRPDDLADTCSQAFNYLAGIGGEWDFS